MSTLHWHEPDTIRSVYSYNCIHNRLGDALLDRHDTSDIHNYRVLYWSNSDFLLRAKSYPSRLHYHRDHLHDLRRAAMDCDNDRPVRIYSTSSKHKERRSTGGRGNDHYDCSLPRFNNLSLRDHGNRACHKPVRDDAVCGGSSTCGNSFCKLPWRCSCCRRYDFNIEEES